MTKSRDYYNSIKEDRYEWRDSMSDRCMLCRNPLMGFRWAEIHEIERRSHAPNRWWHRCNGLVLCRICHDEMDNAATWPHSRQLALKRRMDPNHFDLEAWHEIGRRPLTYVTYRELEDWDKADQ